MDTSSLIRKIKIQQDLDIQGCADLLKIELHAKKQQKRIGGLEEIVNAVAHIGIDFGYGKFEIGQDEIDKARLLIEPKT